MTGADNICHDHSGCITDIKNLKLSDSKQWMEISTMGVRINSIMTRLNVILGSIVVAVVIILLNMLIKIV